MPHRQEFINPSTAENRKEHPMARSETADFSASDWQAQIAELQEQSRQAYLAKDIERLNRLWSDELIVNSPINRVLGKGEVLELLQRGVIEHASYDERIEATERQGEVVIVMGHDLVTDSSSTPQVQRRFTNVWRAVGESWQLVARHANPISLP
jgi:ketosteroid isomerase-like protein